jgi:flagellar basal-body rod protein FlgB
MANSLDATLQFHAEALNLRGLRQQILASNIANADTPGYKARDIDFARALHHELKQINHSDTMAMATTAAGHYEFNSSIKNKPELLYRVPNQPSMDGNTVEPDVELSEFSRNALMMQSAITFLTGTIKSRLSAITGQPS